MSAPATLLVVAKAPVPGQVKTRLCPVLTPDEAAAVAAAALLDTLDLVRLVAAATGSRIVVALTGEMAEAPARAPLTRALTGLDVIGQHGAGLAERLARAHRDAAGDLGGCVQVGMDSPHAPVAALVDACTAVGAADGPDVVLGPATDGGWWCLGLRRAGDARHLADVVMSTERTGVETEAAFRGVGRSVVRTVTLTDLDTPADLAVVAAATPRSRVAAVAVTLNPHGEPPRAAAATEPASHATPVGAP